MDNERDRRSWPDDDRPADAAAPESAADAADATGPEPAGSSEPPVDDLRPVTDAGIPAGPRAGAEPAGAEGDAAPAEIESWPSQEPVVSETSAEETRPWPTDPPLAGSGGADSWPTRPPERSESAEASRTEPSGRMPAESSWSGSTQPGADEVAAAAATDAWAGTGEPDRAPQEVEAYPAVPPVGADVPGAAAAAAAAHSVPDAEGTTGESTLCPRCGTENRPGLSFCRNCGQRLVAAGVASTVERPGTPEGTMACPRCGTHNRAGVAFCQNCGANLRGTAEGYVPPAAAVAQPEVATAAERGAILGPVVLLIGLAGLITAYLLPFAYGSGSLFERAWGADGYGISFWSGYPDVTGSLADQAYFGLAAPMPLLGLLLVGLAVVGFVRAVPGRLQSIGLVIALLWSVGLIVLFLVVEVGGNWDGDIVGLLRMLTPGGIIFFLSSLIVVIGSLTRFSRG